MTAPLPVRMVSVAYAQLALGPIGVRLQPPSVAIVMGVGFAGGNANVGGWDIWTLVGAWQ